MLGDAEEHLAEPAVFPNPAGKRLEPAAGRATANGNQLGVIKAELVDHLVVGKNHRDAARDRHHAKRHDEGCHSYIGYEKSIHEAGGQCCAEPRGDGRVDRPFAHFRHHLARHQHAGHHACETDDRTDRKVDAASDDDSRHPEADDTDEGAVPGDVEEIRAGEERIRRQRQIDQGKDRGDEDPESLSREQIGNRAIGLAVDRIVERRRGRCHRVVTGRHRFVSLVRSGLLDRPGDEAGHLLG